MKGVPSGLSDRPPFPRQQSGSHCSAIVTGKAGTLAVNRGYLRQQILPHFAGRPVADMDHREVRNWFASLRATPAAADRSMPVLSVIMREAEAMGLRPEGSNPWPPTLSRASGCTGHRGRGLGVIPSDQEAR